MCGRYARFIATEEIYTHFRVPRPKPEEVTGIFPSWNVAPQSYQPVIRLSPITRQRDIVLMRWGLVPFFSKSPTHSYSTINARAEDILQKPVFREPMRRRRCLVPINNYFEWQIPDPDKPKKKQAWAIGLVSDEPFAVAGIWDRWEDPNSDLWLETYAIVTCAASPSIRHLHNRMPVIIPKQEHDRWLEPGDPKNPPIDLLVPFPDNLIKAWRIKPDVGNVRNDRPDLIDPIEPEEPPMLF